MIVDGNSLFARSWFAARSERDVIDPPEALRLMFQTLLLLLNPDSNRIGVGFNRMLFGWDGVQSQLKRREEKPPEYYETRLIAKDLLTLLFGAAHGENDAFEGDDIVATAVYNDKAASIYVVSGDKDLQQLHGPDVHYYCLNTKALLSEQFILSRWHVKHPSQIAIALAVIGDSVDNIKGVPKWGPKRCQALFEAVTPEMNFSEALETVDQQIPEDLKPYFYESLDRTLLAFDVPAVPEPAEIAMAEPELVGDLGVPGIAGFYQQVYQTYELEPF